MSDPQHLVIVEHDVEGHATGFVEADPELPQVRVTDVAATRGDGVFETISIGAGHPQALDAHLERFARSARMLDLPVPDAGIWADAVRTLADRLADHDEAWVKTVLTRGVEGQSMPTGWAYGTVAGDFRRERTEGIDVVLLDRGLRSDVMQTSPWLLAGAKSLSYAINRAAAREAARRGADDVVLVSSDGLLLEGPTSTLVVRVGDELLTPPTEHGILPGTTQVDLFAEAPEWGLHGRIASLAAADLVAADAAWLVSTSARGASTDCP